MKEKPIEHIEKIRTPDEDMPGWLEVLREGGFSDEETDTILAHLNKTYRDIKNPFLIEDALKKMQYDFHEIYGRHMSEEESSFLKEILEKKFGEQ